MEYEEYFKKFIDAIGATDTNNNDLSANGWIYSIFEFEGTEETFCKNIYENRFDASFKKKFLDRENYGYSFNELVDLYLAKIDLLHSEYKDLLLETSMDFGKTCMHDFNVIGWREKMSYAAGFKYSDIFRPCNKLVKVINEKSMIDDCRKCWQYVDDPDIFLVSSLGFNFLILIDDLAESLKITPSMIREIVKA